MPLDRDLVLDPADGDNRIDAGMTNSYQMPLKITTWNINSVRLRIDLVAKIHQGGAAGRALPAGDQVPGRRVSAQALQAARLRARRAQRAEGLSRRRRALAPAVRERRHRRISAARPTAATSRWCSARRAGLRDPVTLHNFYVPAGGDEPDPAINPKFAHKLVVPRRDARACAACARGKPSARFWSATSTSRRSSTTSGATSRCCKVVSHTPVECEKLDRARRRPATGSTRMRVLTPEPEKLYTWWSYRAMDNWKAADRGRRLDHIWTSRRARRPRLADHDRQELSRRRAALRPRAGDGDDRGLSIACAAPARVLARAVEFAASSRRAARP